jgi:hypothetical protein
MNKLNFSGVFPLFVEFNQSLYELFSHAPIYVGKFFVGVFYGIILGFLFAFWRNEIIYNSILVSSSLWVLSFFNCITIEWKHIYFLLGISGRRIQLFEVGVFLNNYYFELIIALLICIVFYKTVEKYR